MTLASDGSIVVNALQLGLGEKNIEAMLPNARAAGLSIFIGVVVPRRLRGRFVRGADDALADVVGRLGPKLARTRGRRGQ
jgi:hypothetical protein